MGNPKRYEKLLGKHIEEGFTAGKKYLKVGKSPLQLSLDDARRKNSDPMLIERAEEKGMLDGALEMTYEGAERIYTKIKKVLGMDNEASRELVKALEAFDPVADHDLIATATFSCDPAIRQKVGTLDTLYRVTLTVGAGRRKGYSLPVRQKAGHVQQQSFFTEELEKLIAAIPRKEYTGQEEYHRRLRVLLRKKAERESFPVFKKNAQEAIDTLETRIANERNENLKDAFTELKDVYQEYRAFKIEGANPEFRDPETGATGVLPSLHQKIAIYHLLREKRFGVFDGCGTGKTAIATLAQSLIEKKNNAAGKKFTRTVVVCPNPAKRAWKKGLMGEVHERYLAAPQEVAVINGEQKDERFMQSLREKPWIILNYEQLTTQVGDKLFAQVLAELGVDYVIFDESHHIKSQRNLTTNGNATHSAAARYLAHSAEHLCLLTGSPIPDSLDDYAVLYHLLQPAVCRSPDDFEEEYRNNPRALYTLFNEKTVRRTSEDINEDLEWEEWDEEIELGPVQRQLYQHITEFRPTSWMMQARKALLDPRLVDPDVVRRAGVSGNPELNTSAKYDSLVEMLTGKDGPLACGEKFVIFSSMFRDGVTQGESKALLKRHRDLGLGDDYKKLQPHRSLDVILRQTLEQRMGRPVNIGIIDGTMTDVTAREQIADRLDTDLDGILCTVDTGGESLDLTGANWAFFLDEDYSPKTAEQALARVLRKGQEKKVNIVHLRAKNTLDENLRDYLHKKTIVNKIAVDGYKLTDEEEQLLSDTEGHALGDMIKRGLGGVSINVLDAPIEDLNDFEVKRRSRVSRPGGSYHGTEHNPTDAQRIMQWIGREPIDCWHNPEFMELYAKALQNLSPPIVNRARVLDLVQRARRKRITFPTRVLVEAAGPSLLYDAYHGLRPIIEKHGLRVPHILDRDFEQGMMKGNNPNKILGNMTGSDSTLKAGDFDMVDNGSIALLGTPEEVKASLLEAHRVLRPHGLFELVTENKRFVKEFYSGLETLGFEVLSKPHEGFAVSNKFFKRLKKEKGQHFADSYAGKLSTTHFILARKVDTPAEVEAKNFWFESITPEQQPMTQSGVIINPVTINARESDEDDRYRRSRKGAWKRPKKERTVRPALPDDIPNLRSDLRGGDIRIEE